MTGAQILAKSLSDLGIKHVFGYTGASILPVIDEISKTDIQFIVNANEQCATFSATGYSRSSDLVGVAVVTSGPAITNTLTAVSDANADSIPLIVIAGQVPEYKIGTDSFQHICVSEVFKESAKKVVLVERIEKIEGIIKDAYFFAKAGKPGPVVIDIPINLQQNSSGYNNISIDYYADAYKNEWHLSESQCKKFFHLLSESKKPLFYLGGGLNNIQGVNVIKEFTEIVDIPSVNTLMGKGVVDENKDNSLGLLGMFGTPYANKIIQENDLFIAIGVRWDDRVAEKVGFAIKSKIAYIDINPEKVKQIRLERRPDFSAVGDAAHIINDLIEYFKINNLKFDFSEWNNYAKTLKKKWPLNYNKDSEQIQQAMVIDLLNQNLPKKTIITTGVGNHQLLAAQYIKMKNQRSFLTSGSFGTMGFGVPNAVGAQFANPDSNIIAIDGDGSFRMNMGEIHTIGTYNLPIKILLLNNMSDGMVRNLETTAYNNRHSATERKIDFNFSQMAKIFGFKYSKRVTEKQKLKESITEFLNTDGPSLLEVMTDIEEMLYPIVPVGKGYHDMVLGPYIKEV